MHANSHQIDAESYDFKETWGKKGNMKRYEYSGKPWIIYMKDWVVHSMTTYKTIPSN